MRVLLKNFSNGTNRCMQVTEMYYNPEDEELMVENQENLVTLTGVPRVNAEMLIRTLYSEGSVDLTLYHNDL